MLNLMTTFFIKDYVKTEQAFENRNNLILKIMALLMHERQTILEVIQQIPVEGKRDTGGFFVDAGSYTDIIATGSRFRFMEGTAEGGVFIERFILAPAEQDISDSFFKAFAYNLAAQIIKKKADILTQRERYEYIKYELQDLDIMMDELTLSQISKLVQREFLAIYHRMWSI